MTKLERLNFLRQRARENPPLSYNATQILEKLKEEDSDLGGKALFGECLAPDDVKLSPRPVIEDEATEFATFISPAMREALES